MLAVYGIPRPAYEVTGRSPLRRTISCAYTSRPLPERTIPLPWFAPHVKYNAERADTGGFDQIEILIQLIEVIYHCAADQPFGDSVRGDT
jgi:hypothetical protein